MTTFEDRLLDELKREIELREAGAGSSVDTGAGERMPRRRPLRPLDRRWVAPGRVVPRRIALGLAAGAVAGAALVFVPGSPADSPAYAVERNGDGSVTVKVEEWATPGALRELTERLHREGIHVDVQELAPGVYCKGPRGEMIEDGDHEGDWAFRLHRGDTLAFERRQLETDKGPLSMIMFFAVKGDIAPCERTTEHPTWNLREATEAPFPD
jgi:hypothetical protein